MPATSAASIDTFSVNLNALLSEELELSGQLLEHIALETSQLEQPLSDDVEATLQSKLSLLQRLQETSTRRQNLMLAQGYDCTPQGVEFCSLACAHMPAVRQKFSELADKARECHASNQMLGQLLNRKSGFYHRLLANLSDTGSTPALYQSNGLQDAGAVKLRNRLSV